MSTNNPAAPAPQKKSKTFIIILAVLVIGGVWFGLTKYFHGKKHEETDDAQVEANISPVISKIPGYVSRIFVKDNQYVKKGDTLLVIDDRDLKIVLEQAQAALGTANSNLNAAEANSNASRQNINTTNAAVATANAQIEAAKVNVWRTNEDLKRYENLVKDHSITQQQYEQALAAKQLAERQLQVLVDQKNQASTQTGVVTSQSTATSQQIGVASSVIKQRQVDVENAKLNLSYTVIVAHESGLVSKVPVQEGQYLQAGQSLFSIVLNNDKWVVANFKETQYNKMAEGQKVTIHADAFPDHDFEGVVGSFAAATGSRFALLPPDNASGNFVKVVQRLPVRIEFTNKNDSLVQRLRPGLNVFVDVHVAQ
ncbi:HlyD family secretion protein [Ferruginibacter sp. HRS2-29]|uniref:HlyD family secretion protein n=1 Tax=Ferruginibacter sp. HRS2-29 TaxID=2487334 RepID=UPI0020CFB8A9|nr:HlyD family secretion protein [Ferruginibacter sp. HRS2-29]MCP9753101.1 HlyD family secretion protein [Ferruginibacter sp. HRS2-29]